VAREVYGLPGAARGIGARVEEQNELLAGEILQADRAAAVSRQAKIRGFGARFGAAVIALHVSFRHAPSFRRFRGGIVRPAYSRLRGMVE